MDQRMAEAESYYQLLHEQIQVVNHELGSLLLNLSFFKLFAQSLFL